MKRQTRPFVVEVKKRRGGSAGKRPIWAGIDLERLTNEATSSAPVIDTPDDNQAPDVSEATGPVLENGNVQARAAGTIALRDDVPDAVRFEDCDDGGSVSVAPADDAPRRVRRRDRRRGEAVEALPRGQRWMRRLPAVLLRHKRRES